MCCRSLPGVFGCPNAIDFGQLTGASPSTFMLEDSALPFVSHPIFPSWPHCRDQRLPRKQAHLHTKLQARASRVQWAGTCGRGQLKGAALYYPQTQCAFSCLPFISQAVPRHWVESVLLPAELDILCFGPA